MHDTFALKESAIEVVPSTEAGKAAVIGDDVLESLLDRNWDNEEADSKKAAAVGAAAGKSKATFAVFEANADAEGGGSNLAKLFGEDIQ
jgi:ATP-dependent DNA helicase